MVILYVLLDLLLVLVLLGYFTLLERKTLGYGQVRKGPNKGVVLGLAQPLLDGFKLFMKGFKGVSWASWSVFFVIPGVGLVGVLFLWWMIFELLGVWSVGNSILMIIVVWAFITLFFFITGYMSGCGYGELGAMRTLAQALTYEGVLVFSILMLLVLSCSFEYVLGMFVGVTSLLLLSCILTAVVMESSRTPTDFVEGESELVSGLATEMAGFSFTILFLIEYGLMSFYSVLVVLLFGGVGSMSLVVVMEALVVMVVLNWLRLSLPRSRYDLVMEWGWKFLLGVVFFGMLFILPVIMG
uniref:NADH-ubiquinone oxidoreductase chain 1 n=1 Tax=Pomphorhynchus bulbocolli TaxID=317556 RepID=A0A806GRM4_9BILA|nr:NADH dehydrogenase subunit 1 [Pomphorhynchus bulbocolli]AFJ54193.1 NADH dehydrogenase subunit 1 [Pomphorhynchus bulbocolli]